MSHIVREMDRPGSKNNKKEVRPWDFSIFNASRSDDKLEPVLLLKYDVDNSHSALTQRHEW